MIMNPQIPSGDLCDGCDIKTRKLVPSGAVNQTIGPAPFSLVLPPGRSPPVQANKLKTLGNRASPQV